MERVCRVASLLLISAMMSSGHVVKRADDPQPLEAVVSRLSQELVAVQARLQAVETSAATKVAFHAELPGSTTRVTADAPIHFQLKNDVGGGYDSVTGIYVAPVSGWYTFQYQLYPHESGIFNVDLINNNHLVARSQCDENDREASCSVSTILHVNAGDRVWLQSGHGIIFWGTIHSYLSAALLFAD